MTDPAQGFSFVIGINGLGSIFYHPQTMSVCDVHYGVHITGHRCVMHHNNGFGLGGD